MCFACNPYCGKCRPPKPSPRKCTSCGTYNFDPKASSCQECGTELLDHVPPPVIMCLFCGLICANPCLKGRKEPLDGVFKPCRLRTPPSDEISVRSDETLK